MAQLPMERMYSIGYYLLYADARDRIMAAGMSGDDNLTKTRERIDRTIQNSVPDADTGLPPWARQFGSADGLIPPMPMSSA